MDEGRHKEKRKLGEDLSLRKKISIFVNSKIGGRNAAGLYDIPLNNLHDDFYQEPPIDSDESTKLLPDYFDDDDDDDYYYDDGDLLKYPWTITWPYRSLPPTGYDDEPLSSSSDDGDLYKSDDDKPIPKSDDVPSRTNTDLESMISSSSKSTCEDYVDIPPPTVESKISTDTNYGDGYKKVLSEFKHEICKYLGYQRWIDDESVASIYQYVVDHEARYCHTTLGRTPYLVFRYKEVYHKIASHIRLEFKINASIPRSSFTGIYMKICELEARFPDDEKNICRYPNVGKEASHTKPVVPVVSADKHDSHQPVKTFYQQIFPCIQFVDVDACLWCDSSLYMIPHDYETYPFTTCPNPNNLSPILYNPSSKTPTLGLSLKAKKSALIVAAFDHYIFALSANISPVYNVPEPSFEYLDLTNLGKGWQELPSSPAHKNYKPGYTITGHALVENFLLISLRKNPNDVIYYSFNIQTREWNTVVDNGLKLTSIERLAVVIDGYIYTYHARLKQLFVFSYAHVSNSKLSGDAESVYLSLGQANVVEGLRFNKFPQTFSACKEDLSLSSGAIAIVENRILCVLHTLCHRYSTDQPVCVSIIKLEKSDCCTTLKAFTSFLDVGDDFYRPVIKFCFIRDMEEETNDLLEKGTGLRKFVIRPIFRKPIRMEMD